MPLAKDCFSEVVGLKNDIVHKVFGCPNCKTEVTVSKYQVAGELDIMCARCNMKWRVKGAELLDLNKDKGFGGYKVFIKGEAAQMAQPVPKDSYLTFVKDGMKWKAPAPAPAPAAGTAPKPAAPPAQGGAAAPAAPPAA